MAIPTSTSSTITINEDTARVLLVGDFPFTDTDPGDVLVSVKITTLPTVGTLTLNGAAVTLNQVIPVASITGGTFIYTPALNASGTAYATIGYMVNDGLDDSIAYVLTVDVTAVNDAPLGKTLAISVTQNTTYSGVLPVATDIEGNTPLVYALQVASTYGTTVVNSNGTFTYTPSNNYIGGDSFTYRVTDTGGAFSDYVVNATIVSTKASIPFSAVTTIVDVGEDLTSSLAAIAVGTGAFDGLMTAINAHLAYQFYEGRIKGTDYATVYLGAMQVAITQAVTFVLQKPIAEKQTDSEQAKKALIERQTKGFDDDAKQKLMKQMLDSWSVAYSVAKDANSIPDSIKVNPIDSVTKSAMDALGIANTNNPMGEA